MKVKKLLIMLLVAVMIMQVVMPVALAAPETDAPEMSIDDIYFGEYAGLEVWQECEVGNYEWAQSEEEVYDALYEEEGNIMLPADVMVDIIPFSSPDWPVSSWATVPGAPGRARNASSREHLDGVFSGQISGGNNIFGADVTINLTGSFSIQGVGGAVDIGGFLNPQNVRIIGNGHTLTTTSHRHFRVWPGSTLVLDNVILQGGSFAAPPAVLNQILPGWPSITGGVQVDGRYDLATTPGSLYMINRSVIRNVRAPNGGAVELRGAGGLVGIVTTAQGGRLIMHDATIYNARAWRNIRVNPLRPPLFFDYVDGEGGAVASYGGDIYMFAEATIKDSFATRRGGGVFATSGASVVLQGGTITNNRVEPDWELSMLSPQAGFGGGISLDAADLQIRGGDITRNFAPFGGGVYVRGDRSLFSVIFGGAERNSRVTMFDGTIAYNYAERTGATTIFRGGLGGGVRACTEGDFYLLGGVIRNNQARHGGGVSVGFDNEWHFDFIERPGDFIQLGGSIFGNQAIMDGGGIHVAGGRAIGGTPGLLYMFSGDITGNRAGRDGGGVWVQNNCRIYIGYNVRGVITNFETRPIITGNRANRNGGGVYMDVDTCSHFGLVDFTNNTAGNRGGAMFFMMRDRTGNRYTGSDAPHRAFLYREVLLPGAYLPGREMRFNPHGVFFNGNRAMYGAFRPPLNATTFGAFGWPRIQGSRNNTSSVPGISHPINNWDINFAYGSHRIGFVVTFHLYLNDLESLPANMREHIALFRHEAIDVPFCDDPAYCDDPDCPREFYAIRIPVTPGEEIQWPLTEEQLADPSAMEALLYVVMSLGNIYGQPNQPGQAFWGWFEFGEEDPDDLTYRRHSRTGLRRPHLGAECELNHNNLFERIAQATTREQIDVIFGEGAYDRGNGNLDLFSVWSLWGDANDDDEVTHFDVLQIARYLFDEETYELDGERYFNVAINRNASRVTLGDRVRHVDMLQISRYLFDNEVYELDGERYFEVILGTPFSPGIH